MKYSTSFFVAFLLLVSTVSIAQKRNQSNTINTNDYASFGAKFEATTRLSKDKMFKKYKSLKKGDTLSVKFETKIVSVCKKKGCWMKLDLGNGETAFVKFKDYGFFVPLNAEGSNVIVSGKAFVDVVSVEELKHYAKDGGKPQAEINKINKPEITYSFLADGVLIKK
ncbi:DUF4920 domain-containing protein [Flavobacterium aciduliphilum]|uniref:Uncharacterized protein DUF4920 n=1 Tax=Flavobacterium aciduliphilum TaxID=1101402 RepID=A0A328YA53_9FLAO|nr:DUF4920 domain-containing protein [Flavobacterium aciduliphilum]RAR70043.1 uncharacterized protein DUF4920 [Flavobacterium aciduliphilum]